MDITKWSILKSDWLYSLKLKMEIYCCSFSVTPSRLTLCSSRDCSTQASCPFTNPQSLLKLMSIELVMPSNHLILYHPFSSCLKSFSASGSFPMSQLFASGGQIIGASASASFLPMCIQDWFPLGLTSLSSWLSKGLSRVFSNTTAQKHQISDSQPSLWSISHIHIWLLEKP